MKVGFRQDISWVIELVTFIFMHVVAYVCDGYTQLQNNVLCILEMKKQSQTTIFNTV